MLPRSLCSNPCLNSFATFRVPHQSDFLFPATISSVLALDSWGSQARGLLPLAALEHGSKLIPCSAEQMAQCFSKAIAAIKFIGGTRRMGAEGRVLSAQATTSLIALSFRCCAPEASLLGTISSQQLQKHVSMAEESMPQHGHLVPAAGRWPAARLSLASSACRGAQASL